MIVTDILERTPQLAARQQAFSTFVRSGSARWVVRERTPSVRGRTVGAGDTHLKAHLKAHLESRSHAAWPLFSA
jgi:hypothetical protein